MSMIGAEICAKSTYEWILKATLKKQEDLIDQYSIVMITLHSTAETDHKGMSSDKQRSK